MAIDNFKGFTAGLDSPFSHAEAVVPNDAAEMAIVSRSIWVGGAGNVKVTTLDGSEVTFTNFGPGWLPGRISKVFATGTTATSMVAVS